MKMQRPIKWFGLLIIAGLLSLTSCYTALRGPTNAEGEEENGGLRQADASPSVPDSRLDSYDWYYYYRSAWWQDDLMRWSGEQAPAGTPDEYRRRFPAGEPSADGTVGMPSPTVNAPGLSKGAAGAAQQPDTTAKPPDPRRDFSNGSTSSGQTANPSVGSQTDSGRRDFQSGSHAPTTHEEKDPPKRK